MGELDESSGLIVEYATSDCTIVESNSRTQIQDVVGTTVVGGAVVIYETP